MKASKRGKKSQGTRFKIQVFLKAAIEMFRNHLQSILSKAFMLRDGNNNIIKKKVQKLLTTVCSHRT